MLSRQPVIIVLIPYRVNHSEGSYYLRIVQYTIPDIEYQISSFPVKQDHLSSIYEIVDNQLPRDQGLSKD